MSAHIHQLSCSPGGVPKRAIHAGRIHVGGLADDWQTNREHHGGPDRAVCLFPLELIETLRNEGHPIVPGAVGENITMAGVDWSRVVPGARLQLGEHAVLEIVSYTAPCRTIRAAFHDGNFNRISQNTNPGCARVYARVLTEGDVQAGDPIQLLDAANGIARPEQSA